MNTYLEQRTALVNQTHDLIEGTCKVLPLLNDEQKAEACSKIDQIVSLVEGLATNPTLEPLMKAQIDLMNWTVAALSTH